MIKIELRIENDGTTHIITDRTIITFDFEHEYDETRRQYKVPYEIQEIIDQVYKSIFKGGGI